MEKQDNKCCNYTTYEEYNSKLEYFEFKKGLKMLVFATF